MHCNVSWWYCDFLVWNDDDSQAVSEAVSAAVSVCNMGRFGPRAPLLVVPRSARCGNIPEALAPGALRHTRATTSMCGLWHAPKTHTWWGKSTTRWHFIHQCGITFHRLIQQWSDKRLTFESAFLWVYFLCTQHADRIRVIDFRPPSSFIMVLIVDGHSEHVASVWRKICLFWRKKSDLWLILI